MENNQILAESLLEWTRGSTTTFFEEASDKELLNVAKKIGIVIPSPDLSLFKTIYAEVNKPNKNGVRLPKEVAEKGLPTLIGKSINFEHEGAGRICGWILDAKLEDNFITIIGVFFKSLFEEEFEKIKQAFADKKLFVSFEIWSKDEDGASVLKSLPDGTKEVSPITYHACGLLLENKPACPKARVFKLLANKKIIEEANKIVEPVFHRDENLVYAELALKEECKNCKECQYKGGQKMDSFLLELGETPVEITEEEINSFENEYDGIEFEEAKKITYEQKKNLPDSDFAVIVTVKNKVTGEPRKIRMFPIHDAAHIRNALARLAQEKVKETLKKLGVSVDEVEKKILKKAKELNMTDLLERHQKADTEPDKKTDAQVIQDQPLKIIKVVTEEIVTTTENYSDAGSQVERKGKRKSTRYLSDGKEEVSENEYEIVDKYTQAQLDEAVEKVKSEKDKEIATLKTEIQTLKADVEKNKSSADTTTPPPAQTTDTQTTANQVTMVAETEVVKRIEEAVKKTKEDLEKNLQSSVDELIAAMPKEVSDRVKELIKEGKNPTEAVKQAWEEYKTKHQKAMEDLTTEKDKVIKDKDTEIAMLKEEKEKKIETAKVDGELIDIDLGIGHIKLIKANDETVKKAKEEIDKKAFGSKKSK